MHARTGNGFVQIHQFFTVAEGVEDGCHRSDIEGVRADAHQVVEDAGYFRKHGADVFGANGDVDAEQFFDSETVGLFVYHHGNVVQPIHIRQGLQVGAGFGQFFGAAVQQADVRIGANDGLAFQLQNHAQYAVGSRMLRAEVDGVVSEFSGHRSSPRGQRAG